MLPSQCQLRVGCWRILIEGGLGQRIEDVDVVSMVVGKGKGVLEARTVAAAAAV